MREVRYPVSADARWLHYLHGNVPGHQLDWICRPARGAGKATPQHVQHLLDLIQIHDVPTAGEFSLTLGNLSLKDSTWRPGHGAIGLVLHFRLPQSVDHGGRRNPRFVHAAALVDHPVTGNLLESAVRTLLSATVGDREAPDRPVDTWYARYLACPDEAEASAVLTAYLASFGPLPLGPISRQDSTWTLMEGAGLPREVRVACGTRPDGRWEAVLHAMCGLAAVLYHSNVPWGAITTSTRSRGGDEGLVLRFSFEGPSGRGGELPIDFDDLPSEPDVLARALLPVQLQPVERYVAMSEVGEEATDTVAPVSSIHGRYDPSGDDVLFEDMAATGEGYSGPVDIAPEEEEAEDLEDPSSPMSTLVPDDELARAPAPTLLTSWVPVPVPPPPALPEDEELLLDPPEALVPEEEEPISGSSGVLGGERPIPAPQDPEPSGPILPRLPPPQTVPPRVETAPLTQPSRLPPRKTELPSSRWLVAILGASFVLVLLIAWLQVWPEDPTPPPPAPELAPNLGQAPTPAPDAAPVAPPPVEAAPPAELTTAPTQPTPPASETLTTPRTPRQPRATPETAPAPTSAPVATPAPATPPPAADATTGVLTLKGSYRSAKLALRGKDQKLSAGDNTLNPGRYDLKVTFPDGVQYSKSVEIAAGGRLTVSCSSGLQTCSELR